MEYEDETMKHEGNNYTIWHSNQRIIKGTGGACGVIFLAHGHIKYECFLNGCFWPIVGILTSSSTLGQSGPGSNGNEVAFHSH